MQYRLTDRGKRLWRLYTAFTLREMDEHGFIFQLDSVFDQKTGPCLSCGRDVRIRAAQHFCSTCVKETLESKE